MTPSHYIVAWKIVTWKIVTSIAALAAIALNPTYGVAIIAGVFLVLAQTPAIYMQWLARRDHIRDAAISLANQHRTIEITTAVKANTDGLMNAEKLKNEKQGAELKAVQKEADHAAGRREGQEFEQNKGVAS
jgi:hypothetical protein